MKRSFIIFMLFILFYPAFLYAEDGDLHFISDNPCNFIKPNPIMDLDVISDSSFVSYRTDIGKKLDVYTKDKIVFDIVLDADLEDMSNIFLILSVYDVDAGAMTPEIDKVYLNDRYIGNLTGNNDSWSFTTFPLNREWLNGYINGQPGVNKVRIEVDSLGATTYWVLCDWGAIKANIGFQVTAIDPHSSIDQKGHEIKVKFNEDIDEATLKGNLRLTYLDFNEVKDIRGNIEYDYENRVATFTPLEDLTYGVEYTVQVDTGVTNSEGVNLRSCRTSSFVPLPKLR